MDSLHAHVGPDGILSVRVPDEYINTDVMVLVKPASAENQKIFDIADPVERQRRWREFVYRVAGSIQDPSFIRHEQGEFEQREEF